ncbi:hypothetical protein [Actinomadura sp. NTSP31]|uniref:hypothetical protein n=1 Tax=Actinomadura sp. NTSP31 TaxID=1735447 RepID=UPI0035C12B63
MRARVADALEKCGALFQGQAARGAVRDASEGVLDRASQHGIIEQVEFRDVRAREFSTEPLGGRDFRGDLLQAAQVGMALPTANVGAVTETRVAREGLFEVAGDRIHRKAAETGGLFSLVSWLHAGSVSGSVSASSSWWW